jgi:hypothetical protein
VEKKMQSIIYIRCNPPSLREGVRGRVYNLGIKVRSDTPFLTFPLRGKGLVQSLYFIIHPIS